MEVEAVKTKSMVEEAEYRSENFDMKYTERARAKIYCISQFLPNYQNLGGPGMAQ